MQFPPKKQSTLDFYKEVVKTFDYMHEIKRIRIDDCYPALAKKFHKAEFTIEQIIKHKSEIENYEPINLK
jgi:hypothetical protein